MSQRYFNPFCLEDVEQFFEISQGLDRNYIHNDIFSELLNEPEPQLTCATSNSQHQQVRTSDEVQQEETSKRKKGLKKIPLERQMKGHWQAQQNQRYHWFLEMHWNHFVKAHLRRTDKIFKTMEKFVATREAEQCRSHHQKMQKKYGNFGNILKHLREKHYGSCETDNLLQDMENNELTVHVRLLQGAILKRGISELQQSEQIESCELKQEIQSIVKEQRFTDPMEQFSRESNFLQDVLI